MLSGLHSNEVVVIEDCKKAQFVVRPNQRLNKIYMKNCENCELYVSHYLFIIYLSSYAFIIIFDILLFCRISSSKDFNYEGEIL